jgi:ABC-type Fe3+/spermidine/putrescine transport system ATPase subunit
VDARDLTAGAGVLVSIRPHEIGLSARAAGPPGDNAFAATIRRASYVGTAVDYQVAVAGTDVLLRVMAPVSPRRAPGEAVTLTLDPASCVALPR